MAKLSKHAEWLSLIDISGPFLSVDVLDRAFPQGLETVYKPIKQKICSAYEELCDSIDCSDPDLSELQSVWCKLVMTDFLEFPEEDLIANEKFFVTGDDGIGCFKADYYLSSDDNKPLLFVKLLDINTDLSVCNINSDWNASYADKMVKLCRINNVRLGLITNGEQWMLINAPNGSLSGNISWYARLWFQEPITLKAFSSLLGIRRFFGPKEESLPALLDESLNYMEEVTNTLGNQVRAAVEVLIQGLDKADEDRNRELLKNISASELYEAGLTVMMRLVFLLCAEERGLLLYGDGVYDSYYAVSTLRSQLADDADKNGAEVLERRYDAWSRLLATFRVVYGGIEYSDLRLPALGGSIFDPDKYPFLEGRPQGTCYKTTNVIPLPINNRTVLLLLNSLQVLEQSGGAILLSYRSLDVEQIGHVYEGLLEHTVVKTDDTVLGFVGSVNAKNPNISLSDLEKFSKQSQKSVCENLKKITGRTTTAIKNALEKIPSEELIEKLRVVCGNNIELFKRIKPYANLLRLNAWEQPLIYHKNSFMVTLGQDRRETGAHYTPKVLTEKIVSTALEPIVYDGPQEGKSKKDWKLKTAKELLNLKICDPAMGSGAFLVQVCRYLGDRLVEAWNIAETKGQKVNSQGEVTYDFVKEPMSPFLDERINIARRLIAERCIYGVDINPLAVELAKLSLWLITISKGRPFGYLDHNLKSGDSLLGVYDAEQLKQANLIPIENDNGHLFSFNVVEALNEVAEIRNTIRNTNIIDINDIERMKSANSIASLKIQRLLLASDLLVGKSLLNSNGKTKKQTLSFGMVSTIDNILTGIESDLNKLKKDIQSMLDTDLPLGKNSRRPFHWLIEFPEVFMNGGFDAICGNPPFSGGQHLTSALGTAYRYYLINVIANGANGSADLVAYFYLRAYSLLKENGTFGLIACNTIAEGNTRQIGLERLLMQDAVIFAANPNMKWPGTASVVISPVFLFKSKEWHGNLFLNDKKVNNISAFLSSQNDWSPKFLISNQNKTYQGSIILGLGFTMSDTEANSYLANNSNNREVLMPFLSGDDLNSTYNQKHSRYVINFRDWPLDRNFVGAWGQLNDKEKKNCLSEGHVTQDFPGKTASDYPDLLRIVEEKVRPEREKSSDKLARKKWWLFLRPRPELYCSIGLGDLFCKKVDVQNKYQSDKVLVTTLHTRHFAPLLVNKYNVFSHALGIFILNNIPFTFFSSSIYQIWAWKQGSRLGASTLRYSFSDCFETFPFPNVFSEKIYAIGERYDSLRVAIMNSKRISFTDLYNQFNKKDCDLLEIHKLRKAQMELDYAVMQSYGWNDLELLHDFYEVDYLPNGDNVRFTISEESRIEIMKRLLALNKERWEEEQKTAIK